MFDQTVVTLRNAVGTGIYPMLYWATGLVLSVFFLKDELFEKVKADWKRHVLFAVGLGITILNFVIYKGITETGSRPLDYVSMIVFGIGNGVFETFIFLIMFQWGEKFAGNFTTAKPILFLGGFLFFTIFSGFIHGIFWINEFPQHMIDASLRSPIQGLFIPIQVMLALSWSLLYFLYRDIWGVVILHIIVDTSVIYCIHYSLFTQRVLG
jgi:chlorophyllide a hydrolase